MKEELLTFLKEELQKRKLENEEHNNQVKRLNELKKDPNVKEYINLIRILEDDLNLINISDKKLILSYYSCYLNKIGKFDTNEIHVYLGTFQYNSEIDIVHGSRDFRVKDDLEDADYKIYRNIESDYSIDVPIEKCEEFEKNKIIIRPKTYLNVKEYYEIRDDFFVKAIKTNQETAKKMILKKYKY